MHPFVLGLSHIGLGKESCPENADLEFLREAISSGVMAFDTANVYGAGNCERLLGQVMNGSRERYHITSKAGFRDDSWSLFSFFSNSVNGGSIKPSSNSIAGYHQLKSDPETGCATAPYSRGLLPGQDFSPTAIKNSLLSSLVRLDVEFIDTFLLHSPPVNIESDVVDCMRYLHEWDFCKRIGVSCRTFNDARHFLLEPWVQVIQLPFVSDYAAMEDVCLLADRAKVKIMVRELMQSGSYAQWKSPQATILFSHGLSFTMTDLIRDIFHFPAVESVVVRTGNMQHLAENMLAAIYANANRE